MNAWARTDTDDVGTCRSCVSEHVADMRDKIGNGYGYGCGYFDLRPLTHGTIVKQGGRVMMKNKSYAVTFREQRYIFLRGFLEKPLTGSWSQSSKTNLS